MNNASSTYILALENSDKGSGNWQGLNKFPTSMDGEKKWWTYNLLTEKDQTVSNQYKTNKSYWIVFELVLPHRTDSLPTL